MEGKKIRSETEDVDVSPSHRVARKLGILTQGLVLGLLLSLAIIELAMFDSDVRLFRYQQF